MVVRRIARPLLSSIFVMGGLDAVLRPESKAPAAQKVVGTHAAGLPGVADTTQLVRVDGAAKVLAGSLLALNRFPRPAALALAVSLVPTTFAGHRFWEERDDQKRAMQQLQFAKNASILGGLLLAAADTEGRPSLSWRAHRAAERAARKVTTS